MTTLGRWAVRRPLVFSLLFCFPLTMVGVTISAVLAELFKQLPGWETNGTYIGTACGLLLSAVCFIALMWQFEWLEAAGFRRPPHHAWLVIVPPLLWIVTANFYVSSGTFDLDFTDPLKSTLITVRMLATGLIEETVFRGVILTAMLLAWGQTTSGIVKSFLLSSLLFGSLHLLNLGVRETVPVIANSVYTCFTGALFAGVALRCRSIWPAVLLHGMSNALLSLNRLGESAPEWSVTYTIVRILVHLPLGLYGWAMIRGLELDAPFRAAAKSD